MDGCKFWTISDGQMDVNVDNLWWTDWWKFWTI